MGGNLSYGELFFSRGENKVKQNKYRKNISVYILLS